MHLALVTGGLLYSPNSDKMSHGVSATVYRAKSYWCLSLNPPSQVQ